MNTQTEFRIKLLFTKICIDSTRNGVSTVDDEKKLLEEVDEYAQQQAVEFVDWIQDNAINIDYAEQRTHTTAELYELFLNDQQK